MKLVIFAFSAVGFGVPLWGKRPGVSFRLGEESFDKVPEFII